MGILRSALAKKNKAGKSVGERLVAEYIKLAQAGNTQALEAIIARIDGKPAQSLTLKGDSVEPLHVRHSARLEVEPKPELSAPEQGQDAEEMEGALDPNDLHHYIEAPVFNEETRTWSAGVRSDTDHHDLDSDQ